MEKRVVYGLVVMLMYLVGSGVGQGEVRLVTGNEADWKQSLNTTRLPVVLTIATSLCFDNCDVVQDQVAQLARFAQTYANQIVVYTADTLVKPFFVQLYKVVYLPTVVGFQDGYEILRFENISDASYLYDQVSRKIFGSAPPTSGSALPASGSALPASGSASLSPSPVGQ